MAVRFASAAFISAEGAACAPLRRLRPGCLLSKGYGVYGAIKSLPTVLQGARALYTTAALDTSLVCSAHAPARVYLLWPALQPVPLKLATSWHLVSGAEVKVSSCLALPRPGTAATITCHVHATMPHRWQPTPVTLQSCVDCQDCIAKRTELRGMLYLHAGVAMVVHRPPSC